MASKSIIGVLVTRLQLESAAFTTGMARAVKSVVSFQKAIRNTLVKSTTVATRAMINLATKGFGSIVSVIATTLRGLIKFASFIAGGFISTLGRLTTAISNMLKVTTLVAGGLVAALVLLTRSGLKTIDAMAKTGRLLNIPIEGMQGLKIAASEAGIEFRQFTLGLQRMTRRISEAARGMGEAQSALKQLNLDAAELSRLSPDKQFIKVADALAQVASQGEKIRLGFKLFDSEGVRNILIATEAIRETNRFAKELGITINDFDARNIEAANDAFGRLKITLAGFGEVLASRVAPFLEGFSNAIINKLTEAGGVAEVLNLVMTRLGPIVAGGIDLVARAAENALGFFSSVFGAVGNFFDDISTGAENVAANIAGTFRFIANIIETAFQLARLVVVFGLKEIADSVKVVSDAILALASASPVSTPATRGAQIANQVVTGFVNELDNQLERAKAAATEFFGDIFDPDRPTAIKQLEDFGLFKPGIVEATISKFADLSFSASLTAESIEEFLNKINEAGGATRKIIEAINALIAANTKANDEGNRTIEVLKEMNKSSIEVAGTFSGIFKSAINGASQAIARSLVFAENAFMALKNVAVQMIEEIIAAMIRLAAFKFLASLFPGSSFVAAITGTAGSAAGRSSATSSIASRATFSTPALAGGGDININFFGPTSGDDAIREQVMLGIAEAAPGIVNASVNEVQSRTQRQRGFIS